MMHTGTPPHLSRLLNIYQHPAELKYLDDFLPPWQLGLFHSLLGGKKLRVNIYTLTVPLAWRLSHIGKAAEWPLVHVGLYEVA